ncbi:MAG: Lrp/AsnC family transcriptional regulator [Alphaproteobacteria bacterium]
MDAIDRAVIALLQDGIAPEPRPFEAAGRALGIDEVEVLDRLGRLLDDGTLTRFGPMFDAERMGGTFVLAAFAVPEDRFDSVAELVNGHAEVAHNYARDHALNMWFVVATETPERAETVLDAIEAETGLLVVRLPKLAEYYVGLRLAP